MHLQTILDIQQLLVEQRILLVPVCYDAVVTSQLRLPVFSLCLPIFLWAEYVPGPIRGSIISNIPFDITEEEVLKFFENYETIKKLLIQR